MQQMKNAKGFTIVELLIVIVVIGILAAITLVAYNGIQTRARNTQVITGAAAYNKAIMQYQIDTGSIPNVRGCLGANYPSDQCWVGTSGSNSINATLDAQLAPYIPNKPTLATSLLAMDSANNRAGLMYLYGYPAAGQAELRYYLSGLNADCAASGFLATNEGNLTNCYKRF